MCESCYLLIKVMRICDHWSTVQTLHGPIMRVYGPKALYWSSTTVKFDFDEDLDPAFHSYFADLDQVFHSYFADPDPDLASQNNAEPDSQPCTFPLSLPRYFFPSWFLDTHLMTTFIIILAISFVGLCTVTKIPFMYSFSGNSAASVPFPHSCVCERFIYVLDRSCSRLERPILEIYKSYRFKCRNWKTEHYNSVLEITVSFLEIHKFPQTLIFDYHRSFICSVRYTVSVCHYYYSPCPSCRRLTCRPSRSGYRSGETCPTRRHAGRYRTLHCPRNKSSWIKKGLIFIFRWNKPQKTRLKNMNVYFKNSEKGEKLKCYHSNHSLYSDRKISKIFYVNLNRSGWNTLKKNRSLNLDFIANFDENKCTYEICTKSEICSWPSFW